MIPAGLHGLARRRPARTDWPSSSSSASCSYGVAGMVTLDVFSAGGVAVPARGSPPWSLRDLLTGAHRVDQPDEPPRLAGAANRSRTRRPAHRQRPTRRTGPSSSRSASARILLCTLFDRPLDRSKPYIGVSASGGPAALVHHRSSHRPDETRTGTNPPASGRARRYRTNIDLPGLQIHCALSASASFDDVSVLGSDRAFSALEPLRNLGPRPRRPTWALVEDAARGLAGDDRPGGG